MYVLFSPDTPPSSIIINWRHGSLLVAIRSVYVSLMELSSVLGVAARKMKLSVDFRGQCYSSNRSRLVELYLSSLDLEFVVVLLHWLLVSKQWALLLRSGP